MLKIRSAQTGDEPGLVQLMAEFRVSQAELHGKACPTDIISAQEELFEFARRGFPIYVAEDELSCLVGVLVCRVDGEVVWVEALYIAPGFRRRGVGSALFAQAERLAQELGSDFPYNWVDPENTKIIRFLQKRGYNVLNLIELRRARPGEALTQKINVGAHAFDR